MDLDGFYETSQRDPIGIENVNGIVRYVLRVGESFTINMQLCLLRKTFGRRYRLYTI